MMQYIAKMWKSNWKLWGIICIGLLLFSIPLNTEAQRCMSPELKSDKIAYYTDFLSLTPEESQEFWPIYNEMGNKRRKIHSQLKKYYKQISELKENTSEKEIKALSDSILDNIEKETQLYKTYHARFVQILGGQKALQLYLVERNFRMYLMKKYRSNGGLGHRKKF
ncbi:hypothetical protein OAT16_09045 [Prolixibacteraceae bacterium]|nr:hypothetical protein [Prolixibacteraceae bacterium]